MHLILDCPISGSGNIHISFHTKTSGCWLCAQVWLYLALNQIVAIIIVVQANNLHSCNITLQHLFHCNIPTYRRCWVEDVEYCWIGNKVTSKKKFHCVPLLGRCHEDMSAAFLKLSLNKEIHTWPKVKVSNSSQLCFLSMLMLWEAMKLWLSGKY